jgi:hypothetical protein
MATELKDHERQWHALHALYERGEFPSCLTPGKQILSDRLAPRYWRIKTLYILARVQDDWYRAEVSGKLAARLMAVLTEELRHADFLLKTAIAISRWRKYSTSTRH